MDRHGNVKTCESMSQWHQSVLDASSQSRIMVVECMVKWCGPCIYMRPHVDELSRKFPHLLFLRIDVDQLEPFTMELDIQGYPTFIIMKNGKEIDRLLGANKEELQKRVAALAHQYAGVNKKLSN
ncbi:hypothetical protein KP509_39G057200 [Ceratopteris richardii]|uniref:Thioredoxin domain-containing protein n=1 Tax=Ceratopteris richardii TaxID=49495 RepID=A0A8T2Q1C2_CERRI|nr:hypothetical protein KP509_39G057200 [Ceratopteris richardii]